MLTNTIYCPYVVLNKPLGHTPALADNRPSISYPSEANIAHTPLPAAAYPHLSPSPKPLIPSKEFLLASAYYQNDLQQIQALLQAGGMLLNNIPIDTQNAKGETCFDTLFTAACREGKTEIIALLIHYGANFNIHTPWGESALSVTYHHTTDDTTRYQQMEFLLQKGVDPDISDPDNGWHALLVTAWRDQKTNIFKLLLEYKADPNVYCQYDMTEEISRPLLMEAYMRGDIETVELLLIHGANKEALEYSVCDEYEDSTGRSFASLQPTNQ